jgi:hypothetical protein
MHETALVPYEPVVEAIEPPHEPTEVDPMMKALPDGYHLALSISQNLWTDLLGEALPIQVGQGNWDLVDQSRKLLHAAEDQVKGLLTGVSEQLDEAPVLGNAVVRGARGRAKAVVKRGRNAASRAVRGSVKVTGTWKARVAKEGSSFEYHAGAVTLNARAEVEVEGRAVLFGDQFEIPFAIGRHLDATASLKDIAFNRGVRQLEGTIGDVSLSLGDSLPLRLLKALGDRLISQQIDRFNPLPLIPGSTLENMITPGDGPLKLSAGIDDLHVGINEKDLTLSVRFAFKGAAA